MFAQFKRLTWKACLLTTAISLLTFTIASAAPGDLDTTFDSDGLVTSFVVPSSPGRNDIANGIAVQTNGKIVAAGFSLVPSTTNWDFALTRYNTNGSLDTTFSGDGRLTTNFGTIDEAFDVALQSNGKIVAVGQKCNNAYTICDVALARYNSNGTLDTTFSGNGRQTTDFGGKNNGSLGGISIQSNGKILVAGYMWNGTDYNFAVYRYLPNGNLDTTFSGDGRVSIGFGARRQDYASDLVIQSDGKIVVIGYTGDANFQNNNFAIARLKPGGSLDTTFSGDGRQITNLGGADLASSVALQPNGKIVVAGQKATGSITSFALARYNKNGNLDTTFNTTGTKVFSVVPSATSWATDVIVQLNGKIVVTGVSFGPTVDFALVRLNSSGSFDTTFSGNGKATIDFGGSDFSRAFALQPSDGKYVLAGETNDGTQNDFALARVLP